MRTQDVGPTVAIVDPVRRRPRRGPRRDDGHGTPASAEGGGPAEVKEHLKVGVQASRYYGARSCAACHTTPGNPAFEASAEHVKLNEYDVWRNQDKHSLAYTMLSDERGKAMARRLGRDVTKRETGCLGCHSASPAEMADRVGDAWTFADGVSCENCHGPYSRNGPANTSEQTFRTEYDRPPSVPSLGMIDLRDPAIRQANQVPLLPQRQRRARARTSPTTMYAVWPPALAEHRGLVPSSTSIPRHWFLEARREAPRRYVTSRPIEKADGSFERTKALLRRRRGIALNDLDEADRRREPRHPGDPKTEPGLGWPDYARFDCCLLPPRP